MRLHLAPALLVLTLLSGCPEDTPPVDCSKFSDCLSCTDANGAGKVCGWCTTGVAPKCMAADDASCQGGAGTSRIACCSGAGNCQDCATLSACLWDDKATPPTCSPANLPDGGNVAPPTLAKECEGGCSGYNDCASCDRVSGCGWCDDGSGSPKCVGEDVYGQPSVTGCVDYAKTRTTCP